MVAPLGLDVGLPPSPGRAGGGHMTSDGASAESPSIEDVVEWAGRDAAAGKKGAVETPPRTEAGARRHFLSDDRCSRKSRLT